jgi:hypothetical protein
MDSNMEDGDRRILNEIYVTIFKTPLTNTVLKVDGILTCTSAAVQIFTC